MKSQAICHQAVSSFRYLTDSRLAEGSVRLAADCRDEAQDLFEHTLNLCNNAESAELSDRLCKNALLAGSSDLPLGMKFVSMAESIPAGEGNQEQAFRQAQCSLLSKAVEHTPDGPLQSLLKTGLLLATAAPCCSISRAVVQCTIESIQAPVPLASLGSGLLGLQPEGETHHANHSGYLLAGAKTILNQLNNSAPPKE